MIANIVKPGSKTRGVLNYLYDTKRANDHTDPHLVASWDGFAPDPGREPDATLAQLTTALDLRVKQAGERAPKNHVWHCSIRAAPEDRTLSDAEWATVARRVLNATGIAPAGDPDACRWVAVRHADDHIHIVATKVRGDLTPPRNWNDYLRADKELAAIEKEYGLRQVPRGDRTAAKRPTRAEQEKARRTGHTTTAREHLRTTVRTAVSAATSTEEFFRLLTGAGVLVDIQYFPSGDIHGYKTALESDTNKDGQPVWFSGSTLAPDLSYPKIAERLAATSTLPRGPSDRQHTAWQQIIEAAGHLPDLLAQTDDAASQAHITVLAETLDVLPLTATADLRLPLGQAATAFERASRSRIHARHRQAQTTRRAVKAILREPAPRDGALFAILLDALLLAVVAAQHWHRNHHHDQQAEAARQTAEHLRAAYQEAARQPLAVIHQRGRHLALPLQQRQAEIIRQALPDLADQILAEPTWPALAAALSDTTTAGHNPATLITQAARHRELHTAGSLSEVLTWRLHRITGLHPQPPTTTTPASVRTTAPTGHQRRTR
ncbi:relaxase/mobilization nuclease domain-containing protein [Streptomyces sp. H39-S7]|uniref:relaxase/mobilization nuclease domain-containing protein n=1 Tax=Streptomyces sp. H39-S7 TaxID=3004357 RepID=UPI0022AFF232|nr:relaxase/mobilization nuclease domain-containing protein [Streptomyces sp. H39-S7]MCZ4117910.1 relaxase/mobilization nuclease domain-containing protein [Streptomyces sp. H39-S7]